MKGFTPLEKFEHQDRFRYLWKNRENYHSLMGFTPLEKLEYRDGFKHTRKNTKNHYSLTGFTLVELLVAVFVFSIVVSIALGGLTQALRTQRQAAGLIAANSNVSLAIEQIAREIRLGKDFSTLGGGGNNCLVFTRYRGSIPVQVNYCLNGDVIEREEIGGPFQSAPEGITANNVTVKSLDFIVLQDPSYPPRVTLVVGIGAKDTSLKNNTTYLQTTVSARL